MRKWRAENREKNRQNDLRCRVYRLARQKYGEQDSVAKQAFVREEIARRLGRRLIVERRDWPSKNMVELPFYSAPQQKIELPSIDQFTRHSNWSSTSSSPVLPHLSPTLERRTSSSSISSASSVTSRRRRSHSTTPVPTHHNKEDLEAGGDDFCVLPSMHAFLSYAPSAEQQQQHQQQQQRCITTTITSKGGIKYVESNKILDEFVGVVLNYADNATVAQ
jgi:hypothetical protein